LHIYYFNTVPFKTLNYITIIKLTPKKITIKRQNMKNLPVLNLNSSSDRLFFGDSGHGISRYDMVRYPIFQKLDKKMKEFFWQPHEVDMSQEKRSFDKMTPSDQFVFTANLKRQILLDSVQGRAPGLVFLPHCTDPALENCINTWGFFESIHSESYTHIIRAIYPDPSAIFDDLPNISEIADCAGQVTKAYDALQFNPSKKNLYLALVAANALEAIRFYVSFACTFSFLERGLVEASAKIVKLIARDEAEHLALTQHILKNLAKDDPEFEKIIEECREEATAIFLDAGQQEKDWAKFLFKNGPILGLNEDILSEYVDYLLARRMKAIGLAHDTHYKGNNPLPWMDKHLTSSNTQVAPQEVEISSYLVSSIRNDVNDADFEKMWDEDLNV
jgi:ribonucleoside-diphosphate reductase beta chain